MMPQVRQLGQRGAQPADSGGCAGLQNAPMLILMPDLWAGFGL